MSSLKNKLSLKTFGLVYSFEYDFKCHYNTISPGHLIRISENLMKCLSNPRLNFQLKIAEKYVFL